MLLFGLRPVSHHFLLSLFLLIILLLLLNSCATTPSQSAAKIRDADMNMVENCQFLGDVNGVSGWGNLAASVGVENAKNEAREKAASMGATHIVWSNVSGGYCSFVNGKAYRCE